MSDYLYHVCITSGDFTVSFGMQSPKIDTMGKYEEFVEDVRLTALDSYGLNTFAINNISKLHEVSEVSDQ